jgi:hypothetical protein
MPTGMLTCLCLTENKKSAFEHFPLHILSYVLFNINDTQPV